MSATDRINALKQKHANLEADLAEQAKSNATDDSVVNSLKRQKLAVKDEIERLTNEKLPNEKLPKETASKETV